MLKKFVMFLFVLLLIVSILPLMGYSTTQKAQAFNVNGAHIKAPIWKITYDGSSHIKKGRDWKTPFKVARTGTGTVKLGLILEKNGKTYLYWYDSSKTLREWPRYKQWKKFKEQDGYFAFDIKQYKKPREGRQLITTKKLVPAGPEL
jgi:hypothetical protein